MGKKNNRFDYKQAKDKKECLEVVDAGITYSLAEEDDCSPFYEGEIISPEDMIERMIFHQNEK